MKRQLKLKCPLCLYKEESCVFALVFETPEKKTWIWLALVQLLFARSIKLSYIIQFPRSILSVLPLWRICDLIYSLIVPIFFKEEQEEDGYFLPQNWLAGWLTGKPTNQLAFTNAMYAIWADFEEVEEYIQRNRRFAVFWGVIVILFVWYG